MRTYAPWRVDASVRKPEKMAPMVAGPLYGRRMAVASAEPEDAHLTGMTRSLDRRLLALNLRSVAVAPKSDLKVA